VTRFSSSGYIEEMASGATCLVMGYSGDINIARNRAAAAKVKQDARGYRGIGSQDRCHVVL
jgi:spermidine/putrescine-binding protein